MIAINRRPPEVPDAAWCEATADHPSSQHDQYLGARALSLARPRSAGASVVSKLAHVRSRISTDLHYSLSDRELSHGFLEKRKDWLRRQNDGRPAQSLEDTVDRESAIPTGKR